MINNLPLDVVRYIIPYTYQTQNKKLLNDIVDYKKSKSVIFELYYNFWFIQEMNQAHKDWLINDLFSYANNDQATMFGYTDDFYKLFSRNTRLTSKKKVDKYVQNLETKEIDTQINVFWGLLLPEDRNDMIEEMKKRMVYFT
jgi:hypothetical protein